MRDVAADHGSRGEQAERLVVERVRAVVGPGVEVLPNVHWLLREQGRVREGEADLVIGDPERGILVLEVKAGDIRRDGAGRWWAGPNLLKRSPFEQASANRHALVSKLGELPDWPAGLTPISGDGVALPDVDLDSLDGRAANRLPLDADEDLIADQSSFIDDEDGRRELRAFLDRAFELWSARSGESAPGRAAIEVLRDTLLEPIEVRSMLRHEIASAAPELVRLTEGQYLTLNLIGGIRRASIVGGAGTGKTMLAAEKARRLARQGFETLLVCFNAPLARELADATREVADATGRLTVATFHQLCQDLGREAGVLGDRPEPVPQGWWDETLPAALFAAGERLGPRYHAIVVDEGQDFAPDWLLALEAMTFDGREDVLYVFHDPAQAIYREDVVAQLDLVEVPLSQNCRNPQSIHRLVERLSDGGLGSIALRDGGRDPETIEADDEGSMLEALRKVLHRLRVDKGVPPWQIAVLTGVRLEESAVWRQRRFGNEALDNPAVDDAGRHLGASAQDTPVLPSDAILCETIRRFKGLERPVVILTELRVDPERPELLDRLLYVGSSRATQHLVVIAPAAVLERLR